MENEEEYLTVADAAKAMGLGESTVWLMLKRTDVTRYRIPGQGKRTYLKRSDLPLLKQPVPVASSAAIKKVAA